MANDPKATAPKAPAAKPHPTKEGVSGTSKCALGDCKKGQDKFGFCMEHYEWYMAGIVRGDGRKPLDFEEKFARFQQKSKKVA